MTVVHQGTMFMTTEGRRGNERIPVLITVAVDLFEDGSEWVRIESMETSDGVDLDPKEVLDVASYWNLLSRALREAKERVE